jgi:anti-sigma regulatory factor (Ser/Thr protein kinase)
VHLHPTKSTAPSLQLRLQARPESAPLLRQRLRLWLDELAVHEGEIFDIALATTEAFTNAIEHPHAPRTDMIDIDGSSNERTITITITDSGSWRQQQQREPGGHGFPLMRQLMSTVEVLTQPEGTTVTLRRQLAPIPRFH